MFNPGLAYEQIVRHSQDTGLGSLVACEGQSWSWNRMSSGSYFPPLSDKPTLEELADLITEIIWATQDYDRPRDYWEEHAEAVAKRLLADFEICRR